MVTHNLTILLAFWKISMKSFSRTYSQWNCSLPGPACPAVCLCVQLLLCGMVSAAGAGPHTCTPFPAPPFSLFWPHCRPLTSVCIPFPFRQCIPAASPGCSLTGGSLSHVCPILLPSLLVTSCTSCRLGLSASREILLCSKMLQGNEHRVRLGAVSWLVCTCLSRQNRCC